MLVVRFFGGSMGTPIYQDKESIRIGRSLYSTGKIDEETLLKASKVLTAFSNIARSLGAKEVHACATCAAREAPNTDRLLKIAKHCGIDLKVIPGIEEARLTRLGVIGTYAPRRTLLVDIGGGSTEITLADGDEDLIQESLPLGALRLAYGSGVDQTKPVSPEDYDYLRRCVDTQVGGLAGRVREAGFETVVGSSGTLMTLAAVCASRRGDGDDSYFTLSELEDLMEHLCLLDSRQRSKFQKISGSRADIIIGGGAVAEELMFRMGIDRIEISPNGLREGMRLDYLIKSGWRDHNVRLSSVLALAGRFAVDPRHGEAVASVALEIYKQFAIAGLLQRNPVLEELMSYAARLCEVGAVSGKRSKTEITSAIIRNSAMTGFEPDELETIALLARMCRGAIPVASSKSYAKITCASPEQAARAAMVLKLAEVSDRGRDSSVTGVRVSQHASHVGIAFVAQSDISLALWKMEGMENEFRRIFGRTLHVSMLS